MKVEVVYHRFLGSQNSNFPIFSEYNLKCILRCCTEPFFRIFDFGVTFFEPKKYEIKKKFKIFLWFFFFLIQVLANKNHILGITEDCLALFLAKKSFLRVFLYRYHLKIRKIEKGTPFWKKWPIFFYYFHHIRVISYIYSKNGYIKKYIFFKFHYFIFRRGYPYLFF